jgi:hypothetical protein
MSRWMRLLQRLRSMVNWRPTRLVGGKLAVVLGMVLVGGVAFGLGRWMGLGSATAQQPSPGLQMSPGSLYPDDGGRVVAYIHGNMPVYRHELAEYLIARFGSERLEFLVNRKIVELECKKRGIVITDAEVEHNFRQDLAALGPHTTEKLFYEQVLKPFKKTIFEYKEDVIRQRLAMNRLCEGAVKAAITDTELMKTFEVFYGPKVQCRMIIYKEMSQALPVWERIRTSPNVEAAFIEEAKQQFVVELAAKGGELKDPIHKHFGDLSIEKEAFSLKPGQMSQVIGMKDNTAIILLCQRQIPADPTKSFDTERLNLYEKTKQHKLPEIFRDKLAQLRRDAAPRLYLARQPSIDQVQREALDELNKDLPFRGIDSR